MRAARGQQRGVALITAILVVTIATIAATAMAVSHQIALHRAQTLQESEMGWWYIEGVEQWVMTILQRDAETTEYDSLDEPWAQPVDYLPVDEGVLRGRLEDLQAASTSTIWPASTPKPRRVTRATSSDCSCCSAPAPTLRRSPSPR